MRTEKLLGRTYGLIAGERMIDFRVRRIWVIYAMLFSVCLFTALTISKQFGHIRNPSFTQYLLLIFAVGLHWTNGWLGFRLLKHTTVGSTKSHRIGKSFKVTVWSSYGLYDVRDASLETVNGAFQIRSSEFVSNISRADIASIKTDGRLLYIRIHPISSPIRYKLVIEPKGWLRKEGETYLKCLIDQLDELDDDRRNEVLPPIQAQSSRATIRGFGFGLLNTVVWALALFPSVVLVGTDFRPHLSNSQIIFCSFFFPAWFLTICYVDWVVYHLGALRLSKIRKASLLDQSN